MSITLKHPVLYFFWNCFYFAMTIVAKPSLKNINSNMFFIYLNFQTNLSIISIDIWQNGWNQNFLVTFGHLVYIYYIVSVGSQLPYCNTYSYLEYLTHSRQSISSKIISNYSQIICIYFYSICFYLVITILSKPSLKNINSSTFFIFLNFQKNLSIISLRCLTKCLKFKVPGDFWSFSVCYIVSGLSAAILYHPYLSGVSNSRQTKYL